MPDGLKHPPHLSLPSGVNGQLDPRGRLAGVQEANPGRSRRSIIEQDALLQSIESVLCRPPFDLGLVYLLHTEARVGEAESQFTVVGDDEQALGVSVEAAGGIETSILHPEQVEHGLPAALVASRRDRTPRLVEQHVHPGLDHEGAAVELHAVGALIHRRARAGDDLAVNPDSARSDQLCRFAARRRAGDGDEL